MKKRLKWLVLVLCLVMGLSVFAIACGDDGDDTVAVTAVTLSEHELNLTPGQKVQLTATVTPDNATDKKVTWASSNGIAVSVNNEGMVTAHQVGTVTITAMAGDKTDTCTVTVANLANPYWIAGDIGVAGQTKRESLWGAGKADDYMADLNTISRRRLLEKEDEEDVYEVKINLYKGDKFKIRTLGVNWDGQLNWDNATDKDEDVWGALDPDDAENKNVVGGNGIVFNTGDITGEYGFIVTKDGEYTITVDDSGAKPAISYTWNKAVDPLPEASMYQVELWGAPEGESNWAAWAVAEDEISADDVATKAATFILHFDEGDILQARETNVEDYGDTATWTVDEADFTQSGNQGTFVNAGLYFVKVTLNAEGKVATVTIKKNLALVVCGHGTFTGDGWVDSEANANGTITAEDTPVTVELTLTLTSSTTFGLKITLDGTQVTWAAGGQATGVTMPAGLTHEGDNFTGAAGSYKFTLSITYNATNGFAATITAVEAA